jgi:menaquinone-dependent protoporphyrinogen oxidase
MKTLILYATKHGCAEKCAAKLGGHLGGDVTAVNLNDAGPVDLGDYDTVVIGGSIYAGKIQSKVKAFCERNSEALKAKRLGLFICCLLEKQAQQEFEAAFPAELIKSAAAKGIFGGEASLDQMTWIERFLMKKVGKMTESVSRIDENAILQFARDLDGRDG